MNFFYTDAVGGVFWRFFLSRKSSFLVFGQKLAFLGVGSKIDENGGKWPKIRFFGFFGAFFSGNPLKTGVQNGPKTVEKNKFAGYSRNMRFLQKNKEAWTGRFS